MKHLPSDILHFTEVIQNTAVNNVKIQYDGSYLGGVEGANTAEK